MFGTAASVSALASALGAVVSPYAGTDVQPQHAPLFHNAKGKKVVVSAEAEGQSGHIVEIRGVTSIRLRPSEVPYASCCRPIYAPLEVSSQRIVDARTISELHHRFGPNACAEVWLMTGIMTFSACRTNQRSGTLTWMGCSDIGPYAAMETYQPGLSLIHI